MMEAGKVESFLKFNYLLRPSKQVERKLLIETLHRMTSDRYRIPDYTYIGFGSVYYADFILFHKYLYIDKMICVEDKDIPKRMKFNKPFDFIRLEMKKLSDLLPSLDRNLKYFVWLDYDNQLSRDVLDDVAGLLHILAPGSIFVVTVDAEPRLPDDIDSDKLTHVERVTSHIAEFQRDFGQYYGETIGRSVFSPKSLPTFFATVLRNKIKEEVSKRPGLEFLQLFNFRYADRAQMLSLGGLIDESQAIEEVRRSGLLDLHFIRSEPEPVEISVPPLTIREKQWLDKTLKDTLTVSDLEFELGILAEEMLENFRKYYRHYPTYYETLI